MNNEILHKIRDYIPNEKIRFRKNNGNLEVELVDKGEVITVSNDTWDDIKRLIDLMMDSKFFNCSVCFTMVRNNTVTCKKCSNSWCVNCYVENKRANSGLTVCPFCLDTSGKKCSKIRLELGIQEYFRKLR